MNLIINNQKFKVIESPFLSKDEIRFVLDLENKTFPSKISGDFKLETTIVWPVLENSEAQNKPESFEMYSSSVEQWLTYYLQGNTLYFTNNKYEKNAAVIVEDFNINLEREKQSIISKSKTSLNLFLKIHPLLWDDGNYYNVTQEKQNLLAKKIALYEAAEKVGANYELTWNSTGGVNEHWNVQDLIKLAVDIDAYVSPLIKYQQEFEIQVNKAKSIEFLETLKCDYYSIYPELTPIIKDGAIGIPIVK